MSDHLNITSFSNDRIKSLKKLRKKKERDDTGLFLIDEYREIKRAADSGRVEFDSVYFSPDLFLKNSGEMDLVHTLKERGARTFRLPGRVFAKVGYRERPDGLLAVARHFPLNDWTGLPCGPEAIVFVLESLEKPGNLGTILRSADAVGAGVIVNDAVTDVFNPNVVRSSTGTLFSVPILVAGVDETAAGLKERGFELLCADPAGDLNYTAAGYDSPTAIVLGSEQYGLSDKWRSLCDTLVRIDMKGTADSLNVAMAAVVLGFEAARRKSGS